MLRNLVVAGGDLLGCHLGGVVPKATMVRPGKLQAGDFGGMRIESVLKLAAQAASRAVVG